MQITRASAQHFVGFRYRKWPNARIPPQGLWSHHAEGKCKTPSMLRYSARMLPLVIRASLSRKKSLVSRLPRRVLLSESDFNMHMNQASYARVAEFGRTDWVFRSGLLARLWKSRCKPIVAEQRLVYRRELKPGQRYVIDTRATGFDGRLLKVDSVLRVEDRVHAVVYAKLITIGPDGVLGVDDARELTSAFVTDPLRVEDWRVAES